MPLRLAAVALSTAALAVGSVLPAHAAVPAKVPTKWKNCTEVNKTYKHGVGRSDAKDRTTGKPVTNFTRSTKTYNEAMKYNKGLDRDKDGIACEKR